MTPARGQRGYALVTILMLSVMIVSVTFGYAHKAASSMRELDGSLRVQRVEESVASALAYVQKRIESDVHDSASLSTPEGTFVDTSATALTDDADAILLAMQGTGYETRVHATAQVVATQGEPLPSLTTSARTAATNPSAAIDVTSDTVYEDVTLTGVVRLAAGVRLTLRDVVLHGTIVSHAMIAGTWDEDDAATEVVLEDGVLIIPGTDLPGCAILMPDGVVEADDDANIDVRGVIVADLVDLDDGGGFVHGDVIAANAPTIDVGFELPGSGRGARALPDVLLPGRGRLTRIWFPDATTSEAELDAIQGFSFPGGGGG